MTVLQGSICRLRPLSNDDAERVFCWRTDPGVARNFPSGGDLEWAAHVEWIARAISASDRRDWIIETPKARPVGSIWLEGISGTHRHAEFGYYVGEAEQQDTGIAAEAEYLMLAHAFDGMGLKKVFCESMGRNARVLNGHKRFGFLRDGVLRSHVCRDGEFHDLVVMSILDTEFTATRDKLKKTFDALGAR
jgi:UDP-4-amino-4,6-dideoxy-N-acetyl-beta-L-altrosamine N-acetyltransferase